MASPRKDVASVLKGKLGIGGVNASRMLVWGALLYLDEHFPKRGVGCFHADHSA